ncbi:site-specific DNA-methyltransferase, partial [bacterium]|nr:site-specific DNA-methyltransferase [bacterium]
MPTLNWIGKETVVGHHKEVPFKLLEKDENLSVGDSESGNFLIEGDNLEALKSLLPHYKGKIKCVYIDPPYNTGNENWIYNDNVNSPKMKEWLGNVVGKEDLNKHDKWLCLMYPRIVLLRELLSDDGVIFISIDDNEQAHLKLICDEIFGENNFVGQFVWHKKDNASFLSKEIVTLKEYILMYKKSNNFEGTFDKEIDLSRHRELINISNNVQSRILPKENVLIENGNFSGKVDAGKYGSEQFFIEVLEPFEVKNGFSLSDIKMKGRFSWSQKKIEEEIAEGGKIEIKTIKSFKPIFFREQNDRNIPFRPIVDLLSKKIDSRIETSHDANAEIKKLFSNEVNVVFDYPKPSKLIELLVNAVVRFDFQAIILDSFAGSGTTGHSVLELNKSDGGNRKFILIELETEIAQNVTAKRLEKVIKGYEVEKGSG